MIVKIALIEVFGTQKEVYIGALHENLTDAKVEDFITACQHWNEYMLSQSGITKDYRVLDLGCGNGNTAVWLSQQTDCEVVTYHKSNQNV